MSPSRPGHFIWHDWRPVQPQRVAFYEGLLGWKTISVTRGSQHSYRLFEAAGEAVGGIVPLEPDEGLPGHWISYVAVSDLEHIISRISAAGGEVLVAPTEIPGRGYFAVVRDSQGALIAPLQTDDHDLSTPEILAIPAGHFCWAELWSNDPLEAARFYRAVFDWQTTPLEPEDQQVIWLVNPAPKKAIQVSASSGIAAITFPRVEGVTGWIAFFVVGDIADRLQWSQRHGGGLLLETSLVPAVGYFAVVKDPEGTPFGLFEPLGIA